jgi:hypothetical protein
MGWALCYRSYHHLYILGKCLGSCVRRISRACLFSERVHEKAYLSSGWNGIRVGEHLHIYNSISQDISYHVYFPQKHELL